MTIDKLPHVVEVYQLRTDSIGEQLTRYEIEAEGGREAFLVAEGKRNPGELVTVFQGSLDRCGRYPIAFGTGLAGDAWRVMYDKYGGVGGFKSEIARISLALRKT